MASHEQRLVAFLAGDLDDAAARRFDEHLLTCEDCWAALREDRRGRAAANRLRTAAPANLPDRIRLAIDVTDPPPTPPRPPQRRRRRRRAELVVVAAALAVAAGVLGTVRTTLPAEAPTLSAVLQAAHTLPTATATPAKPVAPAPAGATTPVPLGPPATTQAGGTELVLRSVRIRGDAVVVARASQPFPIPADANRVRPPRPGGMTWSARRGGIELYCPRPGVLLAAAVPRGRLPSLAHSLGYG